MDVIVRCLAMSREVEETQAHILDNKRQTSNKPKRLQVCISI